MRKDNYQKWKIDGTLESKLKFIKELAGRSCGMGVIASELGIKKPVSVSINIFGTATISENELLEIIHQAFNFEPRKITEEINYTSLYKLSSYGHVGVYADELPWERLDKIELLKAIANDY